ncbi:MAG: hypothetical protein EOP11_11395, partial [Proteobacteria bacterium]
MGTFWPKLSLAHPRRIYLGLGLFHCAVIASGIFPSWPGKIAAVAKFRDGYQYLTGAGGGFGFFSPGVGNQLVIEFDVNGRRMALDKLVNQEVSLRIGNMYRMFAYSYGNEKVKRSVAASLATAVFRRVPDLKETTMIASLYRIPSL